MGELGRRRRHGGCGAHRKRLENGLVSHLRCDIRIEVEAIKRSKLLHAQVPVPVCINCIPDFIEYGTILGANVLAPGLLKLVVLPVELSLRRRWQGCTRHQHSARLD